MSRPQLLGVGGAHIDRRGQMNDAYIPGVSNPGTLAEEVGGVVLNALRNARQRGVDASLVSMRGGDMAGQAVSRVIEAAGISDLSAVFLDRSTPSYTALLDDKGDLIAGLADMGLYDMAFPKQLARSKVRVAAASADAVLCDANVPTTGLVRLFDMAGNKPVFAIAISPAKAVRLHGLLSKVSCLFMNAREAARLAQADGDKTGPPELAAILRRKGLSRGVITAGAQSTIGFDETGIFRVEPPRPGRIADVTGAGDALAGVTVAALMAGKPLRQAVREGMAAARLTVESQEAVTALSPAPFDAALAGIPQAIETDQIAMQSAGVRDDA